MRKCNRLALLLILSIAVTMGSGCSIFKGKNKEASAEDQTADELYAQAKRSLDKGNWTTAIGRLQSLEGKYPYGVHAEQAQLDVAYAYYKNSEPGLAIAAADRFIKLHPTHKSVDYAYYLKGLSSFEEDKTNFGFLLGKNDLSDRDPALILNALNAFKDVYTLFPNSRYAPSAKERVAYLTEALARHEIAIASYYRSHGAYVAVVNRAKGVVENYPNTPSVEDALALLVFSYQSMNLPDLADDSRRVLELNFPESQYLSGKTTVENVWYSAYAKEQKKKSKPGMFAKLKGMITRSKPDSE